MRSCGMRFWQKLQASYDQQHPVQPRKLRPAVQILKSSLAFLFENKNARLEIASGPNGPYSREGAFDLWKCIETYRQRV